ncbi:MAG: cation transporter, partial [candidate division Zixibacteria bacterium]|nr:cation transporter [candidate division Zixibacteria bacterium]
MVQKENRQKAPTPHDATREKIVRKVTWVGLLVNVFLAVIKFTAGIYGKSQALVADAIHSLTDLTTDIAVIAGS